MDIVAQIVKYNSQTSGRDKLCRLFQYTSKLTSWYLERIKKDPSLVLKLKNLETNLSATRKVMRMGKSLDMVQGALKSFYIEDTVHRLTLTLSKLNQACYLLTDHFIWAGKVGLVETNTKRWARVSARFWLVTIICSLIRNVYDILSLIKASKRAADKKNVYTTHDPNAKKHRTMTLAKYFDEHQPMCLDIVKNVSDLFLPLSSLGYVKSSTGLQGILGIIGSLISIIVVWNPRLKQIPA